MSAKVEEKYEIQTLIRQKKRTCRCILNPKPEDAFCRDNCQLIIPEVNEIRRKNRRPRFCI